MSIADVDGFARVLKESPTDLLRELAKAYGQIGRGDIESMRSRLPGKLNIRAKGLSKSFKYKSTDPGKASDFSKLFTSEYTGWRASRIFQSGGTIVGKGKSLTVLTDAARGAGGRRKYTQAQLRSMIASGKARFVPTPHGVLIVMNKGGVTKTGKMRKGSASIVLAVLKKQVSEKKRLDFYENFQSREGIHEDILETAVENALVNLASKPTS